MCTLYMDLFIGGYADKRFFQDKFFQGCVAHVPGQSVGSELVVITDQSRNRGEEPLECENILEFSPEKSDPPEFLASVPNTMQFHSQNSCHRNESHV